MVQSTNCLIILVPIPSLPKPPFLTALISCKHSCHFSPLQNTGYPMRKLTIHCGNRPPIKCQGKLPLTQHITPPLHKTQLSKQITFTEAWHAPHIHKSFHSHIFTTLKMSIPLTNLLRLKIFYHNHLTRSDNTANFAFNPISCFTQLRMRNTIYLQCFLTVFFCEVFCWTWRYLDWFV